MQDSYIAVARINAQDMLVFLLHSEAMWSIEFSGEGVVISSDGTLS